MPPRRSEDLDVILNVRAMAGCPEAFIAKLKSLDYQLEGVGADNIGHRFVRGRVKIDVLLPDGLGRHTSREVVPGVHSVEVPGGPQAPRRAEAVRVRVAKQEGTIHRPTLLGAILIKARAVTVEDLPEAQREDLALLLSLVRDPFELADDLRRTERRWLRSRLELFDPSALAWQAIEDAADGLATLRILANATAS